MTNATQAAIDRQIRARDSYARAAKNIPPELHTARIAERHGVSEKVIIDRMKRLARPEHDDA